MELNVAVSQISNPLLFGGHGYEIVLACAVRIRLIASKVERTERICRACHSPPEEKSAEY